MKCQATIRFTCDKKHKGSRACHETAKTTCRKCVKEEKEAEKKRKRAWELDRQRQAKQDAYAAELAQIEDEIEHEKSRMRDSTEDQSRHNVLAQKRLDLANMKKSRASGQSTSAQAMPGSWPQSTDKSTSATTTSASKQPAAQKNDLSPQASSDSSAVPTNWDDSKAKDDWDWQKKYEHAENQALDELMDMIGM